MRSKISLKFEILLSFETPPIFLLFDYDSPVGFAGPYGNSLELQTEISPKQNNGMSLNFQRVFSW